MIKAIKEKISELANGGANTIIFDSSIVTKSKIFINNLINKLSEYTLSVSKSTIYELKLLSNNETIYAENALHILEYVNKNILKELNYIDKITTRSFSVFDSPHIFLTFTKLFAIEMLDNYYIKNAYAIIAIGDIFNVDLSSCNNKGTRYSIRTKLFPYKGSDTTERKTNEPIKNLVPLSNGAEGMIYHIENNDVLKVFRQSPSVNKKEKLKILSDFSYLRNLKNVVLPKYIYSQNETIAGYIMDKIDGITLCEAMAEEATYFRIIRNINKIINQALCTILLCSLNDIVISDLSLDNILVDAGNNIYIIDSDSFQIGNIPSECFQPQYATKELMSEFIVNGDCLSSYIRSYTCDTFAFLVLLFNIITGVHPLNNYQNSCESINFLSNAFILKSTPLVYKGFPDESLYKWNSLPGNLKKLFISTFTSGKGCTIGNIISTLNYKE